MTASTRIRGGGSTQGAGSCEDGAVAVVVAVSLVMFLGFAALAIDLGSAWSTKRDLNTDLDAAALAGARTLADELRIDPSKCGVVGGSVSLRSAVRTSAQGLLAANGGRADVADSDITIDCDRRTVTVAGSQEAVTVFAGVLGVNELNPAGYAVAKAAEGAGGRVLPITFCFSISPIADWVADGATPGVLRRITYGEGPRDECGEFAAGAWGWFGSNNVSTLRQWLATGYPGLVQLPPDRQCTGPAQTADGWCNGGAGAQPNLLDQPSQQNLHGLRCPSNRDWEDCPLYTFVIHGNVRNAQGTNVDYSQVAFLDAVVRGAQRAGNTANSWIDLEFVAYRTSPGEIAQSANSSYMCSADGAPAGDPNCD